MNQKKHTIVGVEKHSIAYKLHIKAGDKLVSVNGQEINDIFDYDFLIADEVISLTIEKSNGKIEEFEFEKDFDADLGLQFDSSLMDEYKSCCNKCIFCFIDQMPPNMRETLYFKDDDSRLSFLQGNYITLTNMKEKDIDRIIRYHMEPINISIHTTNPELRCKMLNNRFAGDVLKYIDKLYEAEISMNAQIVMCPGFNDGTVLDKTISDLMKYAPVMQSVSIVPVGLTKYRDNLPKLEPVTKEIAIKTIETVDKYQKIAMEKFDIHFIHASDEFYYLAEMNMPEEEIYDGYLQLENGVGMTRLLDEEFKARFEEDEELAANVGKRRLSVATGLLAANQIKSFANMFANRYGCEINVYPIRNDFFGQNITVSGLICGCDLKKQLSKKNLGDELLIPINMLRSGEQYFLDDVTIEELSDYLNVKITIVPNSGDALFNAFAGIDNEICGRQIYEQTDCSDCWQA